MENKRYWKCYKCGSICISEEKPTNMCTAPFPTRTSGICGGGFDEETDKDGTILLSTIKKTVEELFLQDEDINRREIIMHTGEKGAFGFHYDLLWTALDDPRKAFDELVEQIWEKKKEYNKLRFNKVVRFLIKYKIIKL